MDNFKNIAPLLLVVALAAAGAAAAIIIPVSQSMRDDNAAAAKEIRESVARLNERVSFIQAQGIVNRYMIKHAWDHGIEVEHPEPKQ